MIPKLQGTPTKLLVLGIAVALSAAFFIVHKSSTTIYENDRENGLTDPDTSRDKEGDTFSIVAYDKTTGQVGGAACSCVSYSGGIDFLSDLITDGTNNPNNIVGAIHSQAAYNPDTQAVARSRMLAGDTPQQIINTTVAGDTGSNSRQYGVVGVDNPGAAGFSGSSNGDYKNDQQGDNALYTYSVQGNILDVANGQDLLDDMEVIFNSTTGTLGDKLMAALQAAKRVGGDSRCKNRGNSGRTAFIQVLSPGETTPGLAYDIGDSVAAVADFIEPIDVLQCLYDQGENTPFCRQTVSSFPYTMDFEQKPWEQEVATCSVNSSWIRTRFDTPTTGTGPSAASQGDLYVFLEASDINGQGTAPRNAIIGSPCFQIPAGQITTMTFDYHMEGTTMGTLSVTANDSSGSGWVTLWTKTGNQGANWNSAEIDLSAYAGSTVKLRINGRTGNGFSSDMAVDNINIFQETPVNCATTITSFPYLESLEGTVGSWSQATVGDDGNWTQTTGGTPSGETGPSGASYGSSYLYLEASDPAGAGQPATAIGSNATAVLNSPCFDLTNMSTAYFNFDYHMYGTNTGSLTLEASNIDGVWNEIFTVSELNVNEWVPTSVNLNTYLGGNVKLRFVGTTGDGFRSDIAIDNLLLSSCSGVTKTWKDGTWSNTETLDGSHPIIIDGAFSTTTNGSIDGCFIAVSNNATITVNAGEYMNIQNDIIVDNGSAIIVEHQGSIVQVNDDAIVTNNGAITVKVTTPTLKPRDFMIMGSPMSNSVPAGVANPIFRKLAHVTSNFIPHPDVQALFPNGTNFVDNNNDDFVLQSGIFNPGEGYYVMPQLNLQDGDKTYDLVYNQGTFNNGEITYTLGYNIIEAGNGPKNKNASPNIVSNPYPSAISASDFLAANDAVDEIYFWQHNTTPSNTFPGGNSANFSMADISMYNSLGGNAASTGGGAPNDYIATAQGFAIKNNGSESIVVFNNSMRRKDNNNTLRNSVNRDRLWLEIQNPTYYLGSSTLIGFTENATPGYDAGYDSKRMGTPVSLYSHLEDESDALSIQGRESFNESIEIKMGFSTQIDDPNAEYSISIANLEGLAIEEATIFLIDNTTGAITNLRENNYTFQSALGTFNNRFTLQFREPVILNNTETLTRNNLSVFPNPTKDMVHITTSQNTITKVRVVDITGRTIHQMQFNDNQVTMSLANLPNAIYFLNIETSQGSIVKRVIKK